MFLKRQDSINILGSRTELEINLSIGASFWYGAKFTTLKFKKFLDKKTNEMAIR